MTEQRKADKMTSMNERTALAALIDEVEAREGWTDPQVVRRATERGSRLTKQDVSLYRQQGMATLVPNKVRALADGLRIPAYRIALAVLADAGIQLPMDARTPEEAIAHDHTLSARTREVLLLLIEQDRQAATT